MLDIDQMLSYPLDAPLILRKRKKLKRLLLERERSGEPLKIAVLGGSTTDEFVHLLEIFLLSQGIGAVFYQCDFGLFYEEAVFDNEPLQAFKPDLIYVHTTVVNVANEVFDEARDRWLAVWDGLAKYGCTVIQNNFELPWERPLGNLDGTNEGGKTYLVRALNAFFAEEAQRRTGLVVHDVNYVAAQVGLDRWVDRRLWFSAKYAMSYEALVFVAFSLSNVIRSVLGRSKKCLVLDLDNTCWGGVIGDDGLEGILLGPDSPEGEAFQALQTYAKALSERGIALAVSSKNDEANAREGFDHPDAILNAEDFAAFQANWDPKHENILEICKQINLSPDALVFLDDNRMERDLVSSQLPDVAVPSAVDDVVDYVDAIDKGGFFEMHLLSEDDLKRAAAYQENVQRTKTQHAFTDYSDYLESLEMVAEIGPFQEVYLDRITQLTNKTNQFNLTTRRYQQDELTGFLGDTERYVTLYGRLKDRFGDNGLVSVVVGELQDDNRLHIFLWLMSCRVLKRGMEAAMFEVLLATAKERGVREIVGEYKRSEKNEMVAEMYGGLGFSLAEEMEEGSLWRFVVDADCPLSIPRMQLNPKNQKASPDGS